MALKIRLARGGAKKRPYYRIVVAEATAPRDGRFIEKVGTYNPLLPRDSADRITLVEDRVKHWLSVGAQPTDRVLRFLDARGLATQRPATTRRRPSPARRRRNASRNGLRRPKQRRRAAKRLKPGSVHVRAL